MTGLRGQNSFQEEEEINTGNRQSCEFCLSTITVTIYQLLLDVAALM